MRNAARIFSPALVATLAACSSAAFAPQPVSPSGTPYAGLDESSYGPRSSSQFRFCDPQDGSVGSPNTPAEPPSRIGAAAQAVSMAVAAPVQGLMKVDASLHGLELTGQFRSPVGSSFPPVAVLSHAKDSIVFWHSARAVSLQEVSKAALAYCSQFRRAVLYRGSSTRCPATERGLTGAPVVSTYAISAYACTTRP
jgi:hypothetical protein